MADELVGGEGHDLLPVGTAAAVILVEEGDSGFVEHFSRLFEMATQWV